MNSGSYLSGDVFLFEPDPGSCLSKLICVLSESKVSHAAMYYKDSKIIEEGLNGLSTRGLDRLGNRKVYIMHHKQRIAIAQTLLRVATQHEATKDPYSIGNLIMLGVLLTCKKKWGRNISKHYLELLAFICAAIGTFIDIVLHPKSKPMTCSQFVYNCYEEAKTPLHLVKGPVAHLAAHNAGEGAVLPPAEEGSVLALAIAKNARGESLKGIPSVTPLDEISPQELGERLEKLCCRFLKWLEAPADSAYRAEGAPSAADAEKALHLAATFAGMVQQLYTRTPAPATFQDIVRALELLRKVYAGFVTPGDLLNHCPDLIIATTIN